jgi:hypothetical protein
VKKGARSQIAETRAFWARRIPYRRDEALREDSLRRAEIARLRRALEVERGERLLEAAPREYHRK